MKKLEALGLILTGALMTNVAHAEYMTSAAMIAWYTNFSNLSAGPNCYNDANAMPSGRQSACGAPTLTSLGAGTGKWRIRVSNGAPFPPVADPTYDDRGFAVFLTTVGSGSRCFEESAGAGPSSAFDSVVHCVNQATGANDDAAKFAWLYRADSDDYIQGGKGSHTGNFAYARVTGAGAVELPEAYNPVGLDPNDVTASRAAAGRYTVTFKRLNPGETALNYNFFPYNVLVQKVCIGDSDLAGCARATCIADTWTGGAYDVPDSSVNVRCYGQDGALRDTGFRVYLGDQAYDEQGDPGMQGGRHFGWANWSFSASTTACYSDTTTPKLIFNDLHEGYSWTPLAPVEACKPASSTGKYTVDFGQLAPYHLDSIVPMVTSRTRGGTYCNVAKVECPASNVVCGVAGGPAKPRATIQCYDRNGAAANAQWNMSWIY